MTGMGAVEARLVSLFDTPEALGVALLVAFGVGVLHALAPGHGKAIAAAYLAAEGARPRDALLLGGTVAGMHTVSVVVLAVAWASLSAAASFATDVVTAWLQVVAALGVIAVGGLMVVRRLRGGDDGHHDHGHDHHHHHHRGAGSHAGHGARLERGTVALAESSPRRPRPRRGLLVALGAAGGLLPSPSAFLVLVSGILTGRVLYAGILVAAFALGMAATLAGVGVAALRGRELLAGSGATGVLGAVHRRIPLVGSCAVLLGGLVYLGAAARVLLAA